ncbi:MAG: ABC transporter substrate-binding protein [Chloroflexi bacterium]|nr:ABC transporter substrate-binding protein [Chloroflexota bacterium]
MERLIYLPGMNEITMAEMLITNKIDMAFSLTAANLKLVQQQNPKIVVSLKHPPYGYLDWWPIGLGFNDSIPPFTDPEIRWAISYALNRKQIVQYAFDGYNDPTALPFPTYPPLMKYLNSVKDLLQKYPSGEFNPTKTEQIMTKKGYKKGSDGMWADSSGKKLSFQIITFPQHPSCTPQAPVVTEQLRQAGFDASFLLPADFATRIFTGEAHAFLWGHGGSMIDPYRTLNLYNSRYYVPTGKPAYTNIYRWKNQAFSNVVDEMGRLPVGAPEVEGLFRKAMEIWLPNLPDVQTTQTVINVPMNETYWTNWPLGNKPYTPPSFWHRTGGVLMFTHLQPVQ